MKRFGLSVALFVALAASGHAMVSAFGAWDAVSAGADAAPGANGATPAPDGYLWWRAAVTMPRDGAYRLRVDGSARPFAVYVNGAPASVRTGDLLTLKRGRNQIAFLTTGDPDGLGPVSLSTSALTRTPIAEWRWTRAQNRQAAERLAQDSVGSGWTGWPASRSGEATLGGADRWAVYAASLPAAPGGGDVVFQGVDDNATIYLNGQRIGAHQGWDEPFEVALGSAWKPDAPNTLMVVVENTNGQGGITQPVEILSYGGDAAARPIAGASVTSGLTPPDDRAAWRPFAVASGLPTFYRTHFTRAENAPATARTLETGYLTAGVVWLNGRLVGRYPTGPGLSRIALPEDALRPGRNTLILFDERGRAPTGARLR